MPKKPSGGKFEKFKLGDDKKASDRDEREERRIPKKKPRSKK